MRGIMAALAIAGLAAPVGAQHTGHAAPAGAPTETRLPAGWQMRIDPGRNPAPVSLMSMGEGFHIETGRGSGVFWHPRYTARGNYEVRATFAQQNAPEGLREAYGVILGGTDMQAEGHRYLYFLVRGTNEYMIRHRAGNELHTIAEWTAHPTVRPLDAGKTTNELVVRVAADSVHFVVNGTQVAAYGRAAMMDTEGQVGLRANHRLDLQVPRFEVVPQTR
ncbi:MAG TPA: hypothetical protein VMM18_05995 [Gemmatimonadaceae bacterium]|nr:hypothetical protein [Gemmatimonadaceae bacterium]